ncbi:MAG: hypothetical protein DHS20C15_16700 [Planctomycetota bacterium]|nr:MAG: hypothetical protein DHS20C15_16700 [Planctomycetota bacterium]
MTRATLLVSIALLLAGCGDSVPPRAGGPRTVVLISLDTLRPDRLGAYGGADGVSPVLDAFAQEAAVFDQALAPAPWTLPSHLTMLTGLDTSAHGVLNAGRSLSGKVVTLAESLAGAGYRTAAFTDGGFVSARNGVNDGFQVFDDERSEEGPNGFTRLLPKALDWLDDRSADDSFFLFLHTFDAHTPYDSPPEETLEQFRARPVDHDPRDAKLRHLRWFYQQTKVGLTNYAQIDAVLNDYDAGVHHADQGVGQVLDKLRALGRYDDALIIVTSDHGEAFLEHGLHVGHGVGIHDDELRVPLMVKFPGGEGAGERHEELVGLVDITRTVLDVEGLEPDTNTQGESLLGLARDKPRRTNWILGSSTNTRTFFLVANDWKYVAVPGVDPFRSAYAHLGPATPTSITLPQVEAEYETRLPSGESIPRAYDQTGDPLAIQDLMPGNEQLFNRRADPDELHDLAGVDEERLTQMRELFQSRQQASDAINTDLIDLNADDFTEIDPAEQRVLAALGYLGTQSKDNYKGVPPKMRTWAFNRHEGPDMTALHEGDSLLHEVRLKVAAGETPSASELARFADIALSFGLWRRENLKHRARVDWRLYELIELAAEVDAPLDKAALLKEIRDN